MYRCPKVILFDLGKVLLSFSHDLMCQQVAELCKTDIEAARKVLFSPEIHLPYERGQISTTDVMEKLEQAFSVRLELAELHQALGNIFQLNTPMVPILSALKSAGWRTGILSNTCDAHWQVAMNKFGILPAFFNFYVTSFEAGEVKPFPGIYQQAIKAAECDAGEILFVDDLLENVESAREEGLDAVLYTSAFHFADDLRKRGVSFNY